MKALLVGLDAALAPAVTRLLGTRGHEQIVAETGDQALVALRTATPALVVVGDPLPDMSAVNFCRSARAIPVGADAVILVITPRGEDLASVLDAGATDLHATSLGPAVLEMRLLVAERLVAKHAQLRDRELKFRRLFESGTAGVVISDANGNFREANSAFLTMLGYTQDDVLAGRVDWESITPPHRLVPDVEERAQLRATGFLPLSDREYLHQDGRRIAALVASAALEGSTDFISYVTNISERKLAETALRASEERYRILFEQSPFPKFLYEHETRRCLAVNEAAIQHYGYSRAEFLRMSIDDLQPAEDAARVREVVGAMVPGVSTPGLYRHRKKDGRLIDVEISVHKFLLGQEDRVLAVALDVTERNRLESQLRQAQKMDAIGRLAGGVAHDFNNLLSVILGYSNMLVDSLQAGDPMLEDLQEISSAGRRAAALTHQLLAFGRQQVLEPRVLDMNAVINGIASMLRRLVGEDVELNVKGAPQLSAVVVDPGQLELSSNRGWPSCKSRSRPKRWPAKCARCWTPRAP